MDARGNCETESRPSRSCYTNLGVRYINRVLVRSIERGQVSKKNRASCTRSDVPARNRFGDGLFRGIRKVAELRHFRPRKSPVRIGNRSPRKRKTRASLKPSRFPATRGGRDSQRPRSWIRFISRSRTKLLSRDRRARAKLVVRPAR